MQFYGVEGTNLTLNTNLDQFPDGKQHLWTATRQDNLSNQLLYYHGLDVTDNRIDSKGAFPNNETTDLVKHISIPLGEVKKVKDSIITFSFHIKDVNYGQICQLTFNKLQGHI